ncbi:translation factor SUA5 [Nitrosomonas aestuarii]|uniref:Threonylcarbamoyl-AMP synthase n=1 Tax=Nitrosomonas aestuarii TaxID=52441 RepID=A0A1I4FP71_9PROT|nr:L-threonylcarbamoyladenylate synthase [Nitrosomonas aestuarii]SFL18616.1 translation factor SUA5 [Nitrosomonas aestuarii]
MTLDKNKLSQEKLDQIITAARLMKTGGVVAFPTETVYGLGADVTNANAIRKVYEIKQRPANHPLIVHIGEIALLKSWAQAIPESAWILANHFWPGPLTLILKRSQHIPDYVTGGQDTVGIRVPAHSVALALLHALGPDKAIAAPSANLYGKISPTSAAHVRAALDKKIDMILDGGACTIGLESTIVGFNRDTVSVLRPGGISVSAIESVLNKTVVLCQNTRSATRVSGSLPAHYAPTTPLKLYPTEMIFQTARRLSARNLRSVVITWSDIDLPELNGSNIHHVRLPNKPTSYGKHLYATLHQYDHAAFDYILMEAPPELPSWLAITDRLQRASFSHISSTI